jgi:hypothetical protein
MTEILRNRDCIVFYKGDTTTVTVDAAMVAGGWAGGQGVQWVGAVQDDRVVTYSSGLYGGFLIWGSNESGDLFTATTDQQSTYRYATMLFGGNLISTSTYERYTYASRLAGGPLVPLTYRVNQPLYFSLRGLFTNEDEVSQQVPPNPSAPAFFVGFVAQIPKPNNKYWLGVQTSM